jgi:hypothetical protein
MRPNRLEHGLRIEPPAWLKHGQHSYPISVRSCTRFREVLLSDLSSEMQRNACCLAAQNLSQTDLWPVAVLDDPPDEQTEQYYRIVALDRKVAGAVRQIVWGSGRMRRSKRWTIWLVRFGRCVSLMVQFLTLAMRRGIGFHLLQALNKSTGRRAKRSNRE